MALAPELIAKRFVLDQHLRSLGRTLVAYSGGTDSAFLTWASHQAIGSNMLAVIADSPSLARFQRDDAVAFARENNIPIEVIRTDELDRPEYVRNDSSRCFHCKDELFTVMEAFSSARGFQTIAYGVNLDDKGDFRPGQVAASKHRVAAPLLEAGLSKEEIRALAHEAGLRIWDKQSQIDQVQLIPTSRHNFAMSHRRVQPKCNEKPKIRVRGSHGRGHQRVALVVCQRSDAADALGEFLRTCW